MAGFEPATSFDTGPQLPAPLTTWNTCVVTGRAKTTFSGGKPEIYFLVFAVDDLGLAFF